MSHGGKGDTYRKVDGAKFSEGYDRIFRKSDREINADLRAKLDSMRINESDESRAAHWNPILDEIAYRVISGATTWEWPAFTEITLKALRLRRRAEECSGPTLVIISDTQAKQILDPDCGLPGLVNSNEFGPEGRKRMLRSDVIAASESFQFAIRTPAITELAMKAQEVIPRSEAMTCGNCKHYKVNPVHNQCTELEQYVGNGEEGFFPPADFGCRLWEWK